MNKIIFDNSPLQEVVIGVQFDSNLITTTNVYDFYNLKKNNFPKIAETNPIPHIVEKLDTDNVLTLQNGYYSRKYFLENDNNKLIQIQQDKLLFNWRGLNGNFRYPNFETILPEFLIHLNDLNNICNININTNIDQLEFTYLNHIILNEFGGNTYQLNNIFKNFISGSELKHLNCTLIVPYAEINGNITIKINSAFSNNSDTKIIIYELTIRGINNIDQTINEWYIKSHDLLLDYFLNSITDKAKETWKMKI